MRTSGSHGYWCEIVPPEVDGRWSWMVQLGDEIVAQGTARWRWLAKSRAQNAAAFEYWTARQRHIKERKREGTRWQPNL